MMREKSTEKVQKNVHNTIKWLLTSLSGALTTGFILMLET